MSRGFYEKFCGTPLTKANLLSDSTINFIGGIGVSSTPDTAFYKIKSLLNTNYNTLINAYNSRIIYGTISLANTTSGLQLYNIDLGFKPQLVIIYSGSLTDEYAIPTNWVPYHTNDTRLTTIRLISPAYSDNNYGTKITASGFSVAIYNNRDYLASTVYYLAWKSI